MSRRHGAALAAASGEGYGDSGWLTCVSKVVPIQKMILVARLSIRPLALAGLAGIFFAEKAAADPGLTITPSIGLSEVYTANGSGNTQGKPDSVTQISPSIIINGETAKATVNLNYSPTFNHFNTDTQPDRVDQSLFGHITVIPYPDQLTLVSSIIATEAGASGNATNQQGILIPTANRVLVFSGTLNPHYQAHFHDFATLDAFYLVNSTNQSDDGARIAGRPSVSSSSLARTAELTLGSAESFGRAGLTLDLTHGDTSGSGPNAISTTDQDKIGVSYHVIREVQLNGSVGYQKTSYPANGLQLGYNNEGLTWNIGATFTPNPLSSASIGFGLQQGAYSPNAQIAYALGPRTNITLTYTVSVKTQLASTAQNLQSLTFDQAGNAINSLTGLPFNPVNQTFGLQNVLFRDKPLLFTITHDFVRSTVSLTANYEVRQSLSGPQMSEKAYGLAFGYTRSLSDLIRASMDIGFTRNTSTGLGIAPGATNDFNFDVSVIYTISDTTTATLRESYFNGFSSLLANKSNTEQLTIGFTRSF